MLPFMLVCLRGWVVTRPKLSLRVSAKDAIRFVSPGFLLTTTASSQFCTLALIHLAVKGSAWGVVDWLAEETLRG